MVSRTREIYLLLCYLAMRFELAVENVCRIWKPSYEGQARTPGPLAVMN